MKKILLDTNAYSRYLKGDLDVLNILGSADIVYMSIFVLGELFTGFKGGEKEKDNINNLYSFLNKPAVNVLNGTIETSEIFGMIKHNLKIKGVPLPINDIWIAAHTLESGSVLITYDGHFKSIENIRLWDKV
jgi:tRNA(fMet)-specific endonuclease VapC